ncbi:MAG: fructose-6-phosphate aldolase, partial [Candidatus Micrarchaeota archaeon]|nr:fructose-6-phosphate aldolase [Candidatus Micrarchaeota archaeon]
MLVYKNYGFKTEVIVASVRSEKHVVQSAEMGAHIATVPPEILEKMFYHPLTDKGIKKFLDDYNAANAQKK